MHYPSVLKIKIFLFFLSLFTYNANAQFIPPQDQFLRMEKINSAKTKRLYIGQIVRYKTVSSDWKSGKIEQLDFLNQMIYFSSGPVRLKDITGIQTRSQSRLAKIIRLKLQTFGVGVVFFSIFNPLTGLPYPFWALYVGPGSFGLGYLLGELFEENYYRIGNRWRLRLIDLTFD